jgi:uncharacterized membrane protein
MFGRKISIARKMWASLAVWAGLASSADAAEQGFWGHQVETQVSIAAPAAQVWTLLMDFERHPQWNPFIKHIEGRPEAAAKLRVEVQPPGGRAMSFEPQVLVAKSPEAFRWKGQPDSGKRSGFEAMNAALQHLALTASQPK